MATTHKLVRWYLGDTCYQERLMDVSNVNDMEWLTAFVHDTESHIHPLVKLVVTNFEAGHVFTFTPNNPLPLVDVVG